MEVIGNDNFGFLFSIFGNIPEPMGFKNCSEMEAALTKPKAMEDILVAIQYDENMKSKYLTVIFPRLRDLRG